MYETIQKTLQWLEANTKLRPSIGIILGSGLGNLVDQIASPQRIPYADIPNFPVSTVEGHSGNLVLGMLGGKAVMAMQGRFHYYEGYSMKELSFPLRVMKAFGIKTLFLSNAAGGLNPTFKVGDIMVITDHLNLFPEHPLRGKNDPRLGTRFPDMGQPYSKILIERATVVAKKLNIPLKQGVYAGWQGPSFETPAEYRMLHLLGADACGMSTVPEVIVARHAGMDVFGLSIITNSASSAGTEKASHEEVQEAAIKAQPLMTTLITELIKTL
ncbi:MAG: purine-nucleoside phosphorylase [Bacteroidales bacterium]|nr:purine-nucleoside phosphorylase [Bacteroidales bacterium]